MKEALLAPPLLPPPRNWFWRLLERCKRARNAPEAVASPMGNPRVPSSAVRSAKRMLQWIMIVPGGARAVTNIDMALDIINGFNVVSTPSGSAGPRDDMTTMAHIL
jgi:hypothetical protein